MTRLAVPLRGAGGVVVVEKAVEAGAVSQDGRGIDDAQAIAIAVGCCGGVGADGRVVWVVDAGHGREGKVGRRVGLVVGCLGLDLAHVDGLGVGELVLVEGVVFDGRADKPDGTRGGLDVQAAAVVDGDLGEGWVLDVVVGCPEPDVLEVEI